MTDWQLCSYESLGGTVHRVRIMQSSVVTNAASHEHCSQLNKHESENEEYSQRTGLLKVLVRILHI